MEITRDQRDPVVLDIYANATIGRAQSQAGDILALLC